MLCVHTLQAPVLFHFSLGAISLALTVHFMSSTMIFGYKAAKGFWGFFLYLLTFSTHHPSPIFWKYDSSLNLPLWERWLEPRGTKFLAPDFFLKN